jgi:hypothetical protein
MHVQSALRGVKEEALCPNWKGGSSKPCGPVESSGGFMAMLGLAD